MLQVLSKRFELNTFQLAQVGIAYVIFILIGTIDSTGGILIPSICAHYHINNALVSITFLCQTIGYLTGALSTGWLVVRLGNRFFLLAGAGLLATCIALTSLLPPFTIFVLLLIPMFFGLALLNAGLNAYLARLPQNTSLLNYLHGFYGIGALLGPVIVLAWLANSLAWNYIYIFQAVFAFLILFGLWRTFKSNKIDKPAIPEGRHEATFAPLLKHGIVWVVSAFLMLYVGVEVTTGNWVYSYLIHERNTPGVFAGSIVSGYWLGLTLGRLLLGSFIRRIGEQKAILLCISGAFVGILIAYLIPIDLAAAIALCWTGFCLGPIFPTVIALTSRLVSERSLVSVVGFISSFASIGSAFYPWIAGNVVQIWGLQTLLPYETGIILIMLMIWISFQFYQRRQVGSQTRIINQSITIEEAQIVS